jgi:phospholipase C
LRSADTRASKLCANGNQFAGRKAMKRIVSGAALFALALTPRAVAQQVAPDNLAKIQTVVVLYAENRSFDALYGGFPGANGLADVTPQMAVQRDRDGSVLKELPPIWGGLTAKGVLPKID